MIPDSYLANMQAVTVDELPWAHDPFKCDHAARFHEVRKGYPHDVEYDTLAGRRFFLGLHAEHFASCSYHARDWAAIADASIVLLGQLTPTSTFHDVLDVATGLLPEGPDRVQLWGLFFHPIRWFPGSEQVSNGQHRTCALRAAGAARCAVWTYRQAIGRRGTGRGVVGC